VNALRAILDGTQRVYHDPRPSALRALGRLEALSTSELLSLAKNDPDPLVRGAAVELVERTLARSRS
jgi:hypothetical protein